MVAITEDFVATVPLSQLIHEFLFLRPHARKKNWARRLLPVLIIGVFVLLSYSLRDLLEHSSRCSDPEQPCSISVLLKCHHVLVEHSKQVHDCEFETSLSHIGRPCLRNPKTKDEIPGSLNSTEDNTLHQESSSEEISLTGWVDAHLIKVLCTQS